MTSTAEKKSCPVCRKAFLPEQSVCPEDGILLLEKDPLIGAVFEDRYEITEFIGQGGMSLVYKAWQAQLERNVAIKLLKSQQMNDPTNVKRFLREAQAAAVLKHPNLNGIYSVGVTDKGQPFLVLEYLEGRSLARVLDEQKPLPVKRAARIFRQIAAALEHAHAQGIIHRDLKPSNVMLTKDADVNELVKVVDFGMVKIMDPEGEAAQRLTQGGEVLGTLMYMSPEQRRAEEVDARSDIFSVGRMLFESVETAGQVPEQLKPIVSRALSDDRDKRYQTATELKAALDMLLVGDPGTVKTKPQPRLLANKAAKPLVLCMVAMAAVSLAVWLSPARPAIMHWLAFSTLTMRGAHAEQIASESLHYAAAQVRNHDFAGAKRTYIHELLPLRSKLNPVAQVQILAGLGMLYCQQGDIQQARPLNDEINQLIQSNLSLDPEYIRTMAMAQTDLGSAIALRDPHTAGRIRRLLEYAERNMRYRRYRDAEAIFKAMLPELDDSVFDQYRCEYLARFADLYSLMHRNKERDVICDLSMQKIAFDSRYSAEQAADLWVQIGASLQQRNQLDKAADFLQKAVSRLQPDKPHLGQIYTLLGMVYLQKGKLTEARQYFMNALKFNKDFKSPEWIERIHDSLAAIDKAIGAERK